MKSLLFGLIFASGLAHADALSVNVKGFNFTYKNPYGQGSAQSFSRHNFLSESVEVAVEKVGEDFKLVVSGAENEEFELKNAPGFMTSAETMLVKDFNLNLSDKVTLSLLQGRFVSKDDEMKLDGVTLDCARDFSQVEVMDQLISGCIQKLGLKSQKFSSSSAETSLVGLLSQAIVTATDEGREALAGVGVNSVDLKISSGKYDLAAEVKAQISGKVKSNGTMAYDASSGKLTVRISEVKFGILNITSKVFDELKKQESEKLVVKKPYVYLTVK